MHSFLSLIAEEDVPQETIDDLKRKMVTRKVPKGHILLRKGDKNSKAYFVKSGCLRSYAIDEKDKEHIIMFAPEGWFISDIDTVANRNSAQLYIDAIEDSEVEILDSELINVFVASTPLALQKLNNRIAVLQKRIIMLMSATLQDRYIDFLETYPEIVQRVPQKMIASYLGVTPEALSKVRGELLKTKDEH